MFTLDFHFTINNKCVLFQALDIHLSVAILRVAKGLDYSQLLGEDTTQSIFEIPKLLTSQDSSADLKIAHTTIHGSCDSLSRNVSQGKKKKMNFK